ncbi:hypothetical protein L208DRAFT_1381273 [Tricholoma matsutake]|nr:hypothetical protein L208DRAFT_1381273 [Tricholoma matsutake 945]
MSMTNFSLDNQLLVLAGVYDSLHAALLKIDSALDTTPAPCTMLVVIGAVMTAAGIVPCVHVWSFVQYDWADPAIFKVSTLSPHSKIGDHNAFPMCSFGHIENVGIPHPHNDDPGKENCLKHMEGIWQVVEFRNIGYQQFILDPKDMFIENPTCSRATGANQNTFSRFGSTLITSIENGFRASRDGAANKSRARVQKAEDGGSGQNVPGGLASWQNV